MSKDLEPHKTYEEQKEETQKSLERLWEYKRWLAENYPQEYEDTYGESYGE